MSDTLQKINAGSFALTFLDYERFKDMMRNDELAIEKVAGRIFYKNKQGHYFSMDTSNRREQFINSIRRDFRERGNLGSYDVYTFDLPVFKLCTNVLSINGVNEDLAISEVDFKDATFSMYFDIVKPVDMTDGNITSTYNNNMEYAISVSTSEENQKSIIIRSGEAYLFSDIMEAAEGDNELKITAVTALGQVEEAYLMGVYIVISHDFNLSEEASRAWTWDGTWKMDGSRTFF